MGSTLLRMARKTDSEFQHLLIVNTQALLLRKECSKECDLLWEITAVPS